MANLGEMFSAARQQRGLPLDEVARRTRIRTDYIAALEQNQFQLLPGDVYARGFVRNYALVLGIPADEAIAAYEETAAPPRKRTILGPSQPTRREPDPIRIEPLSPTPVDTRLRYAPSLWMLSLLAAVVLIVFVLGNNMINGPREAAPTSTVAAPTSTQIGLPLVMVSGTPVLTPWSTPGGPTETPFATVAAGDQPIATPTTGIVLVDPNAQPTATVPPQNGAPPAESPTVQPTVQPSTTPAGMTVQVTIKAGTYDAWLRVTTDGKVVYGATMKAGTSQTWTAQQKVNVRTGRGDLVQVSINGVDQGYIGNSTQMTVEKTWDPSGNIIPN